MTPKPQILSKSDFKRYLECPLHLWLYKFRPDLLPAELLKPEGKYIDEGKEVDELSKGLFPGAVEIKAFGEAGYRKALTYMQNGAKALIQPTVIAENFMFRADILVNNSASGAWDLYEVKSSADVKKGTRKKWHENHLVDVAFQRITLEKAGIKTSATFVVFVNRNFVRHGEVLAEFCGEERGEKGFFVKENVTAAVLELMPQVESEMQAARAILKAENLTVPAKLCANQDECNFLCNLPAATLAFLDIELPPNAARDVSDLSALRAAIDKLQYPLYFFDYETYASPIPLFDGFKPFQNIPFQYSLHVKAAPESPVQHKYFLAERNENPMPALLEQLKCDLGPDGSILVWYENFEKKRNEELAELYPEYAEFLHGANERIFDLMKVFQKGIYWRKEFGASRSLKTVAPVLVPAMRYDDLEIREGSSASAGFKDLIGDDISLELKQKLKDDMLAYCGRDTEVMVKILDFLERELNAGEGD